MSLQQAPIARAQMLIRRPVDVVFESFIDPGITSRFWFTRGSGRLKQGTDVTWHWDMVAATAQVTVKAVEHSVVIGCYLCRNPSSANWIFCGPVQFVTRIVKMSGTLQPENNRRSML